MRINEDVKLVFFLVVLAYVFLMLGNGALSLTNPDEVFYAQTAKEMSEMHTWNVPYLFGHPQFEKPVFTYWLLRSGYIILGLSAFSARFFPAFFAMLGVIAVYFLAKEMFKERKKAFLCSAVLLTSGFYIGMARTVFTDVIFSILILFSLASFFIAYNRPERKTPGIVLFFVFCGLAVLTKGPLGFIVPFLIVFLFLAVRKELGLFFCRCSFWGFIIFLLISLPWYVFMQHKYGDSFIREFFYNDHWRRIIEAEHKKSDTWYFYPLSMLGCMFPWTIFVAVSLVSFIKKIKRHTNSMSRLFLLCWILVVFIVFQIAHSKLTSYIFPLFPALAIIAGDFLFDAAKSGKNRALFTVSLTTWFILFLLPAALLIGSAKYPDYVPSRSAVYDLVILLAVVLAAMLYFLLRRKFIPALGLMAIQIPVCLFFALSLRQGFEAYVSSKPACDYLLKNYRIQNSILCSKAFVRGVRFYTDKEVAVINVGGSQFFSPHPVPYLDSDTEVKDFLKKQPQTFCIVTKSSLGDLKRIAGNEFTLEIIKTFGNEHLLKISST